MVSRRACAVWVGLVLGIGESASAAPSAPCSSAEHRQFDFWRGAWSVHTPDGKLAGTNRIETILGGCVLRESWRSANGRSVGHSFNVYARGRWHQTWVDNQGLLLELVGGLDDAGRMVMRQERTGARGEPVLHEISWTPRPDGTVLQHWRKSEDGGESWTDVFVGIYWRVDRSGGGGMSASGTTTGTRSGGGLW